MENIILTQISIPELRSLFREELERHDQMARQNQPPEENDSTDLILIDEAAKITYWAKSTIYGKVNRREIPFIKKGKRLYFSKNELLEYLKAGKKKTRLEIESEVQEYLTKKKGLNYEK